MSNEETVIMRDIQIAFTQRGCRLFRNNVGKAELADGRWLSYGLAVGSADLIGLTPTGRFLSVEVKTPGAKKPTEEQLNWMKMVNDLGGIAFRARSVEEAVEVYTRRR